VERVVKTKKYTVAGRSFLLAADQPPWKRERNGKLYRASLVAEQNMRLEGWLLIKDWPSGTLYAECKNTSTSWPLGCWSRSSSWRWNSAELAKVDGNASVETLCAAMEM
jgi:hypothetical protein